MSCPYNKNEQDNHWLNLSSDDSKCPARGCPILKEHVERLSKKVCECNPCDYPCDCPQNKCPFLQKHNCSYLNNLKK